MNDLQGASRQAQESTLQLYQAIADVPVTLRAELDRRVIKVRDLMKFDVGEILTLKRPAGENIDLYVGEVLIGTGEILVVDSTLAVRVADFQDKKTMNARRAPAEERE